MKRRVQKGREGGGGKGKEMKGTVVRRVEKGREGKNAA